ncbi:hypothetical protein [Neogemmobacter tilapiae]|uniref:Uncharacterized protein n=1 Tax=Neogemmobacter tilapiae TaxID=875041 RepID=A0A918WM38_9RHOB|nr:hypothetical protein [Gemmobacter tilapiae]GHC55765.1 hypothetical protein GCM10007315_18650 [Gemmobacter tilapiae]
MQKHLTDHEHPKQEEGLRHFWQAARPERPHRWLPLMKQRPATANHDRRVPEYARIARGRTA